MKLRQVLGAIYLIGAFAAPAAAGPYEDAIAAYNAGDYVRAQHRLRPLAEQGDGAAQYKLGFMYERGQGVTQDLVFAYTWYDISERHHTPNAAAARDFMATVLAPSQIALAQRLAREWKEAEMITFRIGQAERPK
jgi:TPR repeat protein